MRKVRGGVAFEVKVSELWILEPVTRCGDWGGTEVQTYGNTSFDVV